MVSFALECEMSGPVRRWLKKEGLEVKDEYVLPWGICDFVGLSFDQERVDKRLALHQFRPIGPPHRIDLLFKIPDVETGESISIRQLRKRLPLLSDDAVEQELEKLAKGGFVVQHRKGSFQRLNGWVPLHNRIVAVELKLSRTSEVLAQAASHRAFASESYIAMPSKIAERAAETRFAEFGAAGVGILGVTRKACKVLLHPSASGVPVQPTLQAHCVERFWRTRDSSS
ncbi:MAG TPA: hypothetical protein VFP59_16855 [Candidatus Angelobacter sp.]|nr:hypothetical protein [Candidatus Angelobacter sp.]